MMNPQVKYFGCAPIINKSFTVPQTQSLPMSPPLNTSGVTTNESVLQAMRPGISSTAASSILFSTSLLKCFPNISFMSWAEDLPPLPCAIVIFITCLRLTAFAPLDYRQLLHRLISVYSCTRSRRILRWKPCMARMEPLEYSFLLQTSDTGPD